MSNLTIGKKIAAGFLVVLIQAMSVGVYAVWKSAQADHHLHQVTAEYLPETELAASLERELLNARIHFIYFVTIQKPGSLDKGWEWFHRAQQDMPKLLAVVQSSDAFAEIRPDAERLRQSIEAYSPVLERIIDCVQGQRNSGPEFSALLAQWASLGGAMVDSAGRLYQQGLRATNQWAAEASGQHATTALVMGCVAGAVIGVLLTFIVTRDISRRMRKVTSELGGAAAHVADAAAQIAASAQSLSAGASAQAASLEETSASSEEIQSMAVRNAENSKIAAEDMTHASARIDEANLNLREMVTSMEEINASSGKISRIIKVIDGIAFQTSILSLNAAVEAARAGEAGMGFAVVAEEVRNLAHRAAEAAKDTAKLIEESIARSNDGKTKLDQVATAIHAITDQSAKVKALVDALSAGSQEQARGIQQISGAVSQIGQVTQRTAATAEESTSAADELRAQSAAMKELVHRLNGMVGGNDADGAFAAVRPTPGRGGMFEWDASFKIGIPLIDSEHEKLFEYARRLYGAIKAGDGRAVLKRLLADLIAYTETHFRNEEEMMRQSRYADFGEHKARHDALTQRVRRFASEFEAGRGSVSVDLMTFLRDWLYEHILKSDQQYVPHVSQARSLKVTAAAAD